ncbi:MAG: Pvc16 family protein [Xenococcus sp. (in: cyanobacteria)]
MRSVKMIRDLSQVLGRILEDSRLSSSFPELAAAQISFERPSETFNPGQTTVNLFLYDIREHLELRNNEPTIEMRGGQAIIHNPPKRIACSYLVTAWPVGGAELPLQEHRLLSQVLQVFSAYPTIPESFLGGTLLVDQEPPLPMVTAQVDGVQSAAEFWTALGNQLRPSLTVTATIAFPLFWDQDPEEATLVITRNLQLKQVITPETGELVPSFFRIRGKVTDAVDQPVVGARVTLMEWDLSAQTDVEGYYAMGVISAGTYTLSVKHGDQVQDTSITVPEEAETRDYDIQLQQ